MKHDENVCSQEMQTYKNTTREMQQCRLLTYEKAEDLR